MRGSPFIKKLLRDDRGATAIEYGLIIALVFVAIIIAVQSVASEANVMWSHVSEEVTKDRTP